MRVLSERAQGLGIWGFRVGGFLTVGVPWGPFARERGESVFAEFCYVEIKLKTLRMTSQQCQSGCRMSWAPHFSSTGADEVV